MVCNITHASVIVILDDDRQCSLASRGCASTDEPTASGHNHIGRGLIVYPNLSPLFVRRDDIGATQDLGDFSRTHALANLTLNDPERQTITIQPALGFAGMVSGFTSAARHRCHNDQSKEGSRDHARFSKFDTPNPRAECAVCQLRHCSPVWPPRPLSPSVGAIQYPAGAPPLRGSLAARIPSGVTRINCTTPTLPVVPVSCPSCWSADGTAGSGQADSNCNTLGIHWW